MATVGMTLVIGGFIGLQVAAIVNIVRGGWTSLKERSKMENSA